MVGVDGSEGADEALRFALYEGKCRGARVEVVMVWGFLDQPGVGQGTPFDPKFGEEQAKARLAEVIERVAGDYPGVAIEPVPLCDLPARALLRQAEGADLLVVGARGLGGFRGLLLGSVSQQAVHHAPCPVVVVPSPSGRGNH